MVRQAVVLLRTCGERTAERCLRLLPVEHVVRATPFAAALAECYRLGIAAGRRYTIVVDADMLPYPHLLSTLLEAARVDRSDWFEKHGEVYCKFFGHRAAGNRIYRTALLPEALGLVDSYGDCERPESTLIKAMQHPSSEIPRVVALHAYEQYERDIYRICYVHAVKSRERIGRYLPKWRKAARRDRDYEIALRGAEAGLRHAGAISIDSTMDLGWRKRRDKPPLGALSPATVKAWKKWEGE